MERTREKGKEKKPGGQALGTLRQDTVTAFRSPAYDWTELSIDKPGP